MVKIFLPLFLFLFLTLSANAQIDIPYSTKWDTNFGQNEWTQYRLFDTQTFDWGFNNSAQLTHDYPVGNTQGDTIRDWMVSPALNFYSTSKLSFKATTFTFIELLDTDYFGIWFSSGSPNPKDGDYVEIVNLTEFSPDNIWTDTTGVEIPFTAAEGYIAIVYIESTNWFTVGISDLVITPDNPVSNSNIVLNQNINIHPSPVLDIAQLEIDENVSLENLNLLIYNNLGQIVFTQKINNFQTPIDCTQWPNGKYYYQVTQKEEIIKVGKLLLQ